MLNYRNLWIIGTSHIAKESVNDIKKFIEDETPDIVAVELDKRRLYALLHNVKSKLQLRDVKHIGFKGFLFASFGSWMQKKLGKMVKVDPGADMKAAAKLAMKKKLKLALIDQDIMVTLKEFSRRLTWRERFRFVGDIFKFTFFKKREMKRLGIENLDLTRVPEEKLVKKLIAEMKNRYPNVHKVLVGDRNKFMARNLTILMLSHPDAKILAVVGAGHKEEMLAIVKKRFDDAVKKQAISI
jgi:pheromone shutdown-related protein TraB